MTNDDKLLTLAKAIIDNHIDMDPDYNREEYHYSCLFCDSNTVTLWKLSTPVNIERDIKHDKDCPVRLSKKVLVDFIEAG